MEISVGIMAHNEANNIGACIGAIIGQKLQDVKIKEIIVVSSSTDKTNDIVKKFPQAKLVIEPQRLGKARAINKFLAKASSEIAVLCSADVIPQEDCIEKLCQPLTRKNIGIVSSRPIPAYKEGFLNMIVQLQWRLQHEVSTSSPKFGELIAFRNIVKRIGITAVDEEYIAMSIRKKGLVGQYVEDAIVLNRGPANARDFLLQRRRIYCGHLQLKRTGYRAASLDNMFVFGRALGSIRLSELHIAAAAMVFEGVGRYLGMLDYMMDRNHAVWKIAKSTK